MVNPDITQYTNLVIYDKDPQDIVDAALVTLQSRLPDWQPSETNIELALLEAMALEVAETIYSINRLPEVMVETLLALYEINRDQGTAPSVTIEFTMVDNAGYTIPSGTEVSIPISGTENLSFFTDSELVIASGSTTGTKTATAIENTITANGVASGTSCELVDAIESVESVETTTAIAGGEAPEDDTTFLTRGIQRLQRLTDTLVIPEHFSQYALEQTYVSRAYSIDNYNSEAGSGVPGDHDGHITVVVYGDGANVSSPNKALLLAGLDDNASGNLGVHLLDPTINTVNVAIAVKKVDAYTTGAIETAVEDALTEYLNPATWDWSGTVRRNEIIALVSNIVGVDYVVSLTTPSADITYSTQGNLVTAGTITVTVT
jgi:uncharacterized phage protein gp47/JayE